MGIFDRFPYSSTHEMNLDFMLGKATEIAEDMQTVATGMAQVQAGLSAISEKTEQATQAAAQAAQSASSIEGSVTAAEEAAEEAQMHNESAQTWANNAMTYKADCQRSATEAAASSASAAQAATEAAASEDTVATYAQAANASAQSAANNNDSAHQYANQASASASNATFHSSNAQTAATNANTSATNAETAATNAQTAATRASALKDDCQTLHSMCTTAVDLAANSAAQAANSAAQAAASKTDVENLVESLPEDFTDLNNHVNQLSDEIVDLDYDVNGEKNYIEKMKLITAVGDSRGDTTPDSNFSTTEFIPISVFGGSGKTVKVDYGTIGENSMFAVYDSSKNFLDSWGLPSSATERQFTFSYASYTDPAFVRFSFQNGYSARVAIMSGATESSTAWAAGQNGGISDDVDNLKNAVNAFPESYMETVKYMDYSMENRLNPADCELNTIITPSSGSVDTYNGYFTTDFIPIRTGETLYFYRIDTKAIKPVRMFAAYDADKNVISDHGSTSEVTSITQSDNMAYIKASLLYLESDYARSPENTAVLSNANPVYIPGYGNFPVIKSQYLERHTMWVRSTDTEAQIIQKFVDAFNTGNVDVYFERATYQFGTELAKVNTDYGMLHNEIPIGNGCRYYFNGATLVANIDLTQHPATSDGEFYVNLLGCQRRPSSYELHDGVLIATDTRYVVHDESSALNGSYKHLYQNMEMHYHTNQRQETIRKCIGGGTGASGVVEIIGCKFTTDAQDSCVSFHGNGTDIVGAEFDLNVRDCWLSNSIRAGELSANQTGRFYYTGNSAASEPATYDRWTVTKFLNEVRT